ncbi:hypothetical protein GCK32_014976 [Trichostrongylus colubriformis]|uniref:Uncharacterized protein n=1 Tax=Trichostrongylus colubriformis TaxID=6319 RepID=A0AAN8FXU0_TRICO
MVAFLKVSTICSGEAGPFDNFEAFDLEDIDRDASSGEAKAPSRKEGGSRSKQSRSEENIGEFFPES